MSSLLILVLKHRGKADSQYISCRQEYEHQFCHNYTIHDVGYRACCCDRVDLSCK